MQNVDSFIRKRMEGVGLKGEKKKKERRKKEKGKTDTHSFLRFFHVLSFLFFARPIHIRRKAHVRKETRKFSEVHDDTAH